MQILKDDLTGNIWVSMIDWNDPNWAFRYNAPEHGRRFHYVKPEHEPWLEEIFGDWPEYPGEYINL